MHSQIRDRLFTSVHGLQSQLGISLENDKALPQRLTLMKVSIHYWYQRACKLNQLQPLRFKPNNVCFWPRQSPVEICQKYVKSRRQGEQGEASFYRSVCQFSCARQDGQIQCASFNRNFGTETNGDSPSLYWANGNAHGLHGHAASRRRKAAFIVGFSVPFAIFPPTVMVVGGWEFSGIGWTGGGLG
ncbi:hypothetical protein C8R43DRAFT_1111899 [Mycena crocata]|nr:hypothetical protein C8R43DRAFT_1111899 [Mycena crocata]